MRYGSSLEDLCCRIVGNLSFVNIIGVVTRKTWEETQVTSMCLLCCGSACVLARFTRVNCSTSNVYFLYEEERDNFEDHFANGLRIWKNRKPFVYYQEFGRFFHLGTEG